MREHRREATQHAEKTNDMTKRQNDYSKKLQDPRWQRKRLEVMQAAGWKCSVCQDDKEELNVHHPDYSAHHEPWEYSNLQCLCSTCHTIQHLQKDKMLIHARMAITQTIIVKHYYTLTRNSDGLMKSLAENGDLHSLSELHKIRMKALNKYNDLERNLDSEVAELCEQLIAKVNHQ